MKDVARDCRRSNKSARKATQEVDRPSSLRPLEEILITLALPRVVAGRQAGRQAGGHPLNDACLSACLSRIVEAVS